MTDNWESEAACSEVGGDLWFPGTADQGTANQALRICAGCPVRDICLEVAMRDDIRDGIWGNKTPFARDQMRRAANRIANGKAA